MEEPPHIKIGLKEIFLKMEELADKQQEFGTQLRHISYQIDESRKRDDTQDERIKTLFDRPYIPPATIRATFMVVIAFAAVGVAVIALFVK